MQIGPAKLDLTNILRSNRTRNAKVVIPSGIFSFKNASAYQNGSENSIQFLIRAVSRDEPYRSQPTVVFGIPLKWLKRTPMDQSDERSGPVRSALPTLQQTGSLLKCQFSPIVQNFHNRGGKKTFQLLITCRVKMTTIHTHIRRKNITAEQAIIFYRTPTNPFKLIAVFFFSKHFTSDPVFTTAPIVVKTGSARRRSAPVPPPQLSKHNH